MPRRQRRRALVLFTRDLRVHDHAALTHAVHACEQVIPLFVLDRELLARTRKAPNRLAFLLESLRDLDRSLTKMGARLILREGDPVEEAMRIAHTHGVTELHVSADVTPYARMRERRLARECATARVPLQSHPGVTIVPAAAVVPAGGDHYRVFTPYWRAWSTVSRAPLLAPPRSITLPPHVSVGRLPALPRLSPESCSRQLQRGGETAGRLRLARWLRAPSGTHPDQHDDLAGAGTSQLSPYLHFGCLSANTVLTRAGARADGEAVARRLCWRDFHHQVLAARPDLPRAEYRPRGDRWRRSEREARAWREGETGYPIVDAGMRQLRDEGFMHNRARLIVGSFLTKTLYLDWRLGAAHFAALLLDADVANNVGNWQWVAGTGNDTRPNRVLNPIRQARRFDPNGDYVRRYVPELAQLDASAVHQPWVLGSVRRKLDYPERLVDHEEAFRNSR